MKINLPVDKSVIKLKPDVFQMLSSLKPGQTVSAKVISQEFQGQTLIELMGGRLSVNIDKLLSTGQRIFFEVSKEKDSNGIPVLKLLEQNSENHGQGVKPGDAGDFQQKDGISGNRFKAFPSSSQKTGSIANIQNQISAESVAVQANSGKPAFGVAVLSRMPEIFSKNAEAMENKAFPAKVIKMTGNATAVFSIKGEEISARISVPLHEGRMVFLEKTKPGKSPEFRILQPGIAQETKNLAAFAQSEGSAGAFPKLVDFLMKIQPQPVKATDEKLSSDIEKLMQTLQNQAVNPDIPKSGDVSRILNKLMDLLLKNQQEQVVDKKGAADIEKMIQGIFAKQDNCENKNVADTLQKIMNLLSKMQEPLKSDTGKIFNRLEAELEKLMQAVQNIALSSETPKPDFIQNLIKNSGLSWENKLASAVFMPESFAEIVKQPDDIKGLILGILSEIPDLPPDVGKTLELSLSSIDRLQMLNRISINEGGVFVLPFPVFSDGAFSFGQIFFDFSERRDDESREKPFRVSVLLDMTSIGKIRADVSFMKKLVSGVVVVDSEPVRKLFAENMHELENRLTGHGFDMASFSVRLPKNNNELEVSSVFSKMVEKSEGINLTA